MDKRIVGIDVAKHWLDICAADSKRVERIDNTAEAIGAWLKRSRPSLVAFEPTGGYERTLQAILHGSATTFVRVHPNDVVAFRKSRAIKAKTDQIDARLIAAFAAEELTRRAPRRPIVGDEALREIAARRRQLINALHAERCRLALAGDAVIRASLEAVIAALASNLDTIEAEFAARIAADPHTAELAELLQTVKGVGPVTAMTLIADLPEIGQLSGKQIAALVGLAPHTHRSGKTRRPERVGFGRPGVRAALFNAARAAIRHETPMHAFYQRLVMENRRPGKVALTAVMRKILVTLNAVARDRQSWRHAQAA